VRHSFRPLVSLFLCASLVWSSGEWAQAAVCLHEPAPLRSIPFVLTEQALASRLTSFLGALGGFPSAFEARSRAATRATIPTNGCAWKIVSQLSAILEKNERAYKVFREFTGVHVGLPKKLPNQPPEKLWRYLFPPNGTPPVMVEIIGRHKDGDGSGFIRNSSLV